METTAQHAQSRRIAAGIAVVLAVFAAFSLGIGSSIAFVYPENEFVFTALWMFGVVLLVWAAITDVVVTVGVVVGVAHGRRPAAFDVALVLVAAAMIAVVVVFHPLMGSGSAAG